MLPEPNVGGDCILSVFRLDYMYILNRMSRGLFGLGLLSVSLSIQAFGSFCMGQFRRKHSILASCTWVLASR